MAINHIARMRYTDTPCLDRGVGYEVFGGYRRVRTGRKQKTVHRLLYELCYGPIPKRMMVLHGCDNAKCCNPFHLSLGTALHNTHDRRARGRSNGHDRKLTTRQVLAIRRLIANGDRDVEIAKHFSINRPTVSRIRWGHTYANVV